MNLKMENCAHHHVHLISTFFAKLGKYKHDDKRGKQQNVERVPVGLKIYATLTAHRKKNYTCFLRKSLVVIPLAPNIYLLLTKKHFFWIFDSDELFGNQKTIFFSKRSNISPQPNNFV